MSKKQPFIYSIGINPVFQQLLIWALIYVVYTLILKSFGYHSRPYAINLLQVSMFILAYFFLKKVQIPLFYTKGKMVPFIFSLLIAPFLIFVLYTFSVAFWFNPDVLKIGENPFLRFHTFLLLTVRFYSPALAIIAWESHRNRKKEMQRMKALEKEKITTELRFLKAQINPHFLFNTLNNLYSYVVTESPKAPDMIVRLTGILDYVLYKSQSKTVPLSDELDTIQNFLGLEQIRYGDRLEVEYTTAGNLTIAISPLILLSLVENAFKHGASGDIDFPRIRINIEEKNETIYCDVWNTKSERIGELNDAYKKGIGLSNIKRQLNLIYPNNHQLKIDDSENTFNVSLILDKVND